MIGEKSPSARRRTLKNISAKKNKQTKKHVHRTNKFRDFWLWYSFQVLNWLLKEPNSLSDENNNLCFKFLNAEQAITSLLQPLAMLKMPCLLFAMTFFHLIKNRGHWSDTSRETKNTIIWIFSSKKISITNRSGSWGDLPLGAPVSSSPGQKSEPAISCQQGLGWVVASGSGGVRLWALERYLTRLHSDSHLCVLAYRSCSPVCVVKYSWRCSHCHLRMFKLEETPGRKKPSLTEALILRMGTHSSHIPAGWMCGCLLVKFTDRT